jgi:multiple sugar transport system permease protein
MALETPVGAGGTAQPPPAQKARSRARPLSRLRGADRVVVATMVVVPTIFVLALVWFPAIASIVLSFTNWTGIGDLADIEFIGTKNYVDVATIYPPFWPAMQHNLVWLLFLFVGPTVLGIFFAVLLDKEMHGSRFYQTALYIPVVLALALIGFIWQLIYSPDQGLLNDVLNTDIDWYGDPSVNLWAVLFANGWKHTGYIMLLYLAGLKGVDSSLREAAAVDGSGEVSTFFRIILPVMRPINLIVIVVVVIESLRAFDLVWVINKGRNGLELIAALVTQNVIGEASRIGFASAMSTIMLLISSVFIIVYLRVVMKEER